MVDTVYSFKLHKPIQISQNVTDNTKIKYVNTEHKLGFCDNLL